jgi:hypothetical protein
VSGLRFPIGLALALTLAMPIAGCGQRVASTVLVVEIHSDLGDRIDNIVLLVDPPGPGKPRELSLPAPTTSTPVQVGLVPGAGHERGTVALTARGRKGQAVVAEQQLETEFTSGAKTLIVMHLAAACVTNACQEACGEGGTCIPRRQPTVPLESGPPDAGTPKDGPSADGAAGTDGPAGVDAPGDQGGPPVTDGPPALDVPAVPVDVGVSVDSACACPSDDNPCTTDVCEAGVCKHNPLPDRMACTGGVCLAGNCCTGCVDGAGMCRPGSNVTLCGRAGASCSSCDDKLPCTQDRCENGACQSTPQSGTTCPGGVCVAGSCRCGGAGEACCAAAPVCNGGLACQNGTCGACGAEGQVCCASNMCASGRICENGSCRRCGGVGQPCCADGSCAAGGMCQAASKMCIACGGAGQTCCPTGDPCGTSLVCAGGSCTCGGFGQPCCAAGTACTDDHNACNGTETCQAGSCGRIAPVTCVAKSQCHTVGVCNPATGACSEPLRPDDSLCNDGNPCSSGDRCLTGNCVPRQAGCDDFNSCTANTCNPSGCTFPPLSMNTPCGSNNQCQTAVCGANANCMVTSRDGQSCTQTNGTAGVCSGDVCCPVNSPNCG